MSQVFCCIREIIVLGKSHIMVILLAQITQTQKTRLKVDFYTVVLAFC